MNNYLRSQLEKLQNDLHEAELGESGPTSAAQALRTSVGTVLQHFETAPDRHDKPLYEQLRQALLGFESAHPTLSASVQNVIDTLVQMGV